MTAGPRLIPLDDALALIRARFAEVEAPIETVALAQAAGRVLAVELRAPRDVPGFRHSAMDGYAVYAGDLSTAEPVELEVLGTLLAGATHAPAWRPGGAVRIMTGAPMPDGTDTVVIKEHSTLDGDRVRLLPGTTIGANVREADDDYAADSLALRAGTRIGAAEIGVAAAFGYASLPVRVKPRVAVLVTGDELVGSGATSVDVFAAAAPRADFPQAPQHAASANPTSSAVGFGQRHDSNGPMLAALLAAEGARVVAVERVGDDAREIATRLAALARETDLVVTSGGVSAGEADHVPRILERQGRVHFWKVRMRPGMPVLFGEFGAGTPVFALPGNPVSVYATFAMLVRPALAQLAGATLRDDRVYARLAEPLDKRHDRVELRRATLVAKPDGTLEVALHESMSSGALRSVVESDALAVFAAEPRHYAAGEVVPVIRRIGC